MMLRPIFLLTCGSALTAFAGGAVASGAGTTAPESAVRAFVEAAVRARHGEAIPVIVRLTGKLPSECTAPEPSLPRPGGRLAGTVLVAVRCANPEGQERVTFVRADVAVEQAYWIAARNIAAGAPIGQSDVTAVRADLANLPRDILTDVGQITGQVARRALREGAPLRRRDVSAPELVSARDRVMVRAEGTAFALTRDGTALDGGQAGETIRVRTSDGRTLRAQVFSRGEVRVSL